MLTERYKARNGKLSPRVSWTLALSAAWAVVNVPMAGAEAQGPGKPQAPAMAESDQVTGYPVARDRLDALAKAVQQQFPPATGVRVAPDTRTSQLVVIASPTLQAQIAAFVRGQTNAAGTCWRTPLLSGTAASSQRVPPYHLQNITWRDCESSLQRLWGNGLVITPDAAGASATVHLAADPARQTLLQINRQTNEIHFPLADETSRSWRQVVAALDRSPTAPGAATQLVPLRRADPAQVQQAVTMIRDAALRANQGDTLAAVPIGQAGRPRGAREPGLDDLPAGARSAGGTTAAGRAAGTGRTSSPRRTRSHWIRRNAAATATRTG